MTNQNYKEQKQDLINRIYEYGISMGSRALTDGTFEPFNLAKAGDALDSLLLDIAMEAVGEDYIFERPKKDYLPNVYQFLKGKNEGKAEARTRIKQLVEGERNE